MSGDDVTRPRRRIGTVVWTAIVAGVALAGSLIGLVFDIRPDLRGDPRTTLGADVSVFAVDPHVTYGQHLRDLSFSGEDLRARLRSACGPSGRCGRLQIPGQRIYVRALIEGFKSRETSMRLSLYDARTRTRIPEINNVDVASQQLDSPSDRSVVPVWLVCPPDPTRRYFVRVELYHHGDSALLAVGDSRRFTPRC